ncbi:MAG: hypothetical protein DRO67_01260 [Candidatus Asgardarchaeum californiense]|nr:MAG: hypothetical protein DRO67_01260 [Candidatus Asgardarchaeum californiense]
MRIFVLGICALLFVGCAQSQFLLDSSVIMTESSELKDRYATVERVIREVQAEKQIFTDAEWRKLLNVDATIDMLIARVDNITRFSAADVSMQELEFLWGLSVNGYTEGRSVIFAHWDQFDPSTQIMLNAFDAKAEATSTLITELMKNPTNDNMTKALTLMTGIVSLAVKMLAIAAI